MQTEKIDTGSSEKFPLIGLGASAGGLKALRRFFKAMPAQTGMSFVVVQHLSPDKESILPELLQKETPLKVQEIQDEMPIRRGRLYVIPPGYELQIQFQHFQLSTRPKYKGWPRGIDAFLASLGESWSKRAAALILSGAGDDGTEGARIIREYQGLVIAQDPETTVHRSMPGSVIDAGLANTVLAPEEMPQYLLDYFGIRLPEAAELSSDALSEGVIEELVQELRRQTGRDVKDYKPGILQRQIAYRMGNQQIRNIEDYLELIRQRSEAQHLLKSLLIPVTAFFRDAEAFEALKTKALLPLLKGLSSEEVLRIWVAGCASGEEAVSLAILIEECLQELKRPEIEVRIFATDINADIIQRARSGLYPESIARQLSPERLQQHFRLTEYGYQLGSHLRERLVYAEHNLITDPPFSNLHLISCRNVLIYFQPAMQEKLRTQFEQALLPQGLLFLGSSETMPLLWQNFTALDSQHRIYQRGRGSSEAWMQLDQPLFVKLSRAAKEPVLTMKSPKKLDEYYLQMIRDVLLRRSQATCLIVDEEYQIRYRYGEPDRYLRLVPGGESQQSVLEMIREALQPELTLALHQAFETQQTIIREGIRFSNHGQEELLRLIVEPVPTTPLAKKMVLTILEAEASASVSYVKEDNSENAQTEANLRLREALQQAQQALHTTTLALQAKKEELSAFEERLESTNETLRSAQEEQGAMNEELNTLNTQLTYQNKELSASNNTLYNLLQSSAVAMIFLDMHLAIREYTEASRQIFRLRREDIGRPIAELKSQLVYDKLIGDIQQVLDTLVPLEQEIPGMNGDWYKVEIRPSRSTQQIVDGIVLIFTDISLQKQLFEAEERRATYLNQLIDTLEDSLLELDTELRVLMTNTAFYTLFQVKPEETIGQLLYNLGNGQWDIPELRRLLTEIIPQQRFVRNYLVTHEFPQIGRQTMRLNARQIQDLSRILLVITDLRPG